jgi:hypothetical protein
VLRGSSSKTVFKILIIGVIPLPAAKATIVLLIDLIGSNTKRPFGGATS